MGNTGCITAEGSPNKAGYGRVTIKGKRMYAHRVAYEQHKGQIPEGMMVCHTCDNPICINPDHLFLGTQKDNMSDAKSKGRNSPPPVHAGEDHHLAQLSDDEVNDIRGFHLMGIPQVEIARMYNVSRFTINKIVNHKVRKV